MSRAVTSPGRSAVVAGSGLLLLSVLLLALNLRGPVVAVSAVAAEMQADLGVSATVLGLYTSVPLLCFGLGTPLASFVLARIGLVRAVLVATVVLAVGVVVRSVGGLILGLAGTVVMGLAISVANIAVPVVIGKYLPRRASAALGGYAASLNLGAMIALGVTAPVAQWAGWRASLLLGAALAMTSAAVWLIACRQVTSPVPDIGVRNTEPPEAPGWWRRPVVWGLTVSFACLSFGYMGITAWLPLILQQRAGMDMTGAGLSATVFQAASIVGGLAFAVLRGLIASRRALVLVFAAATAMLPVGLLLVASLWPVWCAVGGFAQGGGLALVLSLVVEQARSQNENRRMSALVQGGGYVLSAPAASAVGGLHDLTGAWEASLVLVTAVAGLLAVAGVLAAGRTPAGHTS